MAAFSKFIDMLAQVAARLQWLFVTLTPPLVALRSLIVALIALLLVWHELQAVLLQM